MLERRLGSWGRGQSAFRTPQSALPSDRGGSRTHTHEALNLTPLPVGVPGRSVLLAPRAATRSRSRSEQNTGELQTRESNPASRLMRPERAPARLQFQSHAPDSNRAAEIMTLGRAPARVQSSSDGGSRTHTSRFLRPRPLPVGLRHCDDPCGNRTRVPSVRGWRPEPLDERALIECGVWNSERGVKSFHSAFPTPRSAFECVGLGSNLPRPKAPGLQSGGTPLCRPTHDSDCLL